MTRIFSIGTSAAALLLAATVTASAQSAPTAIGIVYGSQHSPWRAAPPVRMSYITYTWQNTMAHLGLGASDSLAKAESTRTAPVPTHTETRS